MKLVTKSALLTILSIVMFGSMLFADGTDPVKESSKMVKISGQVIDQNTGETLAGVKLIIQSTNEVIYTDFDGQFQIQCDLSKNPKLSVSLISYEGKTIKIEGTNSLNIKLERQK